MRFYIACLGIICLIVGAEVIIPFFIDVFVYAIEQFAFVVDAVHGFANEDPHEIEYRKAHFQPTLAFLLLFGVVVMVVSAVMICLDE